MIPVPDSLAYFIPVMLDADEIWYPIQEIAWDVGQKPPSFACRYLTFYYNSRSNPAAYSGFGILQ